MQHKDQRLGIFIDVQNLYHSAKNLYNARVNFKELVQYLRGDRQLIRAIAYVVRSEGLEGKEVKEGAATGESAFFDALKQSGIELRMKDIQVFPGGMKKADWDVGMAVDAIRMASMLDVIILVTGDGDFVPLVEYGKWGLGRVVEVAGFSRTASARIKDAADVFVSIENIPNIFLKEGRVRSGRSSRGRRGRGGGK